MAQLIEPASVPDAGAFLARLVRLDPAAVVRLRPVGGGAVALWGRLPFEVLVTRTVRAAVADDLTVRAAELLAAIEHGGGLPARHDAAWRWPLPPGAGRVLDRIAAIDLHRVAAAAAATVQTASTQGVGGRAVGSRMLREALLDYVPIVVSDAAADDEVPIPQRLVQAVIRMGFVSGPDDVSGQTIDVRRAGAWVGLAGGFGTAWYRPPSTVLLTARHQR